MAGGTVGDGVGVFLLPFVQWDMPEGFPSSGGGGLPPEPPWGLLLNPRGDQFP